MDKINSSTILSSISCGFPSSIDDFSELSISLDKYLIQNPESTFMAYANGNSMNNVGIYNGDILIIDRSLAVKNGDVIVAILYGEFVVKQIAIRDNIYFLIPHNNNYDPLKITFEMDFEVWGIVISSIRKHR